MDLLTRVEAWLRRPRGLVLLWLVATAAVAVVRLLMWWGGVPGWDDAAHVYKVLLVREGVPPFWDNHWYGGSYGAVTYGVVFYWLAAVVPRLVLVTVASGVVPVLFFLYQRVAFATDDVWPAWLLAGTLAAYQAHGQDPFLVALALTMAGLVLLVREHPVWAALPVAVGVFTNPLALVVGGVFLVADFIARPCARRPALLFAAALAPALALRLLVGLAFSEPAAYLNETSQLAVFVGYALAGLAVAGVNAVHERRPFLVLFATYAAACALSYVIPGSPVGNNIGRFFMVFGVTLLFLLRHSRLRRPLPWFEWAMVVAVLFGVVQFSTAAAHFYTRAERPQTTAAFFAPALAHAAATHVPDYRVHVVALRRHWEAYRFPAAGYPVTRGWYRQADAIHNGLFYTDYGAAEYVAWLRRMGVAYVYLADGPLDPWSRREALWLRTSPAFVRVARVAPWTVYRLRSPAPLLVGLDGGEGHVLAVGHDAVRLRVARPGRYLLKFTWNPYWRLAGGPGRLRPGPARFLELDLGRPGTYTVRVKVTVADALRVAAARL